MISNLKKFEHQLANNVFLYAARIIGIDDNHEGNHTKCVLHLDSNTDWTGIIIVPERFVEANDTMIGDYYCVCQDDYHPFTITAKKFLKYYSQVEDK